MFVDFARDEHKVQSWNDFGYLEKRGVDMETLNKFKSIVRKGDWVCKSLELLLRFRLGPNLRKLSQDTLPEHPATNSLSRQQSYL